MKNVDIQLAVVDRKQTKYTCTDECKYSCPFSSPLTLSHVNRPECIEMWHDVGIYEAKSNLGKVQDSS